MLGHLQPCRDLLDHDVQCYAWLGHVMPG